VAAGPIVEAVAELPVGRLTESLLEALGFGVGELDADHADKACRV
jgi:hypothetical protein